MAASGQVAIACLIIVLIGCGRTGPERVTVSGLVTYRGEPVKHGEIRFIPIKGTDGPSWGALIVDGQYAANGSGGVPVGTHRVEIVAPSSKGAVGTGRRFDTVDSASDKAAGAPAMQQYLPAKYNARSELELTIKPGSSGIVQDFTLTD